MPINAYTIILCSGNIVGFAGVMPFLTGIGISGSENLFNASSDSHTSIIKKLWLFSSYMI